MRLSNQFFLKLRKGMRILLFEHRIPGTILSSYYSAQKFLGKKVVKLRTREGLSIECLSGSVSMFVEVFHKEVYKFGNDELNNTIVIDIGGNQAFFSLYAAWRGAFVYSFEPCAENIEIFEQNVLRNNLSDRIVLFRAAVTGLAKSVNLFVGFDRAGDILSGTASIMNSNRGGSSFERREVLGIPINELFDFAGIDRCDLMKIDCEGAEYEINDLATMDTLRRIDRLVIEFHRGPDQILDKLLASGFHIQSVDSGQAGLIKVTRLGSAVERPTDNGVKVRPRKASEENPQLAK